MLVGYLMFNLKSVLKELSGSASPFDEGTGEFNPVDIDNAKRNLQLEKRAAENGLNGVPGATKKSKDVIATDIDSYISQLISMAKDKYQNRIRAIEDLTNTQTDGSSEVITELFSNGVSNIRTTARRSLGAKPTSSTCS